MNEDDSEAEEWFVVALAGVLGIKNRCFAEGIGLEYPGADIFVETGRELKKRNIESMTLDVAQNHLAEGRQPKRIRLLSDMGLGLGTPIAASAYRRDLLCLESPLQSKLFHLSLPSVSRHFDRAFLFAGLHRYSRAGKTYVACFPITLRTRSSESIPVGKRKFMVAINSNKSPYASWSIGSPLEALRAISRNAFYRLVRPFHGILKARDLYSVRKKVFSQCLAMECLDLFGEGWQELAGLNFTKGWQGRLDGPKCEKLGEYRFCLCFENCEFPGYVTEKIYDCFMGGTVPVYLGAPDIAAWVPPAAFVDFRKYRSTRDLVASLRNMDTNEIERMLAAGREVLRAEGFARHAPAHWAKLLAD